MGAIRELFTIVQLLCMHLSYTYIVNHILLVRTQNSHDPSIAANITLQRQFQPTVRNTEPNARCYVAQMEMYTIPQLFSLSVLYCRYKSFGNYYDDRMCVCAFKYLKRTRARFNRPESAPRLTGTNHMVGDRAQFSPAHNVAYVCA